MPRSAAPSGPTFVARPPGISSGDRAAIESARRAALAELRASPFEGAAFLVRAWAGIFAVEASLRVLGYKRTLRWIERVPARRRVAPRTSVLLGERLVRRAYLAHAAPGGCLPRSLVQYLLHRRDGTRARLVVGVRRPDPAKSGPRDPARGDVRAAAGPGDRAAANESASRGIEAHAWVESDAAAPIGVRPFAPIFSSGDSR